MTSVSGLAFSVENECGCNERPVVLRALNDGVRDFFARSESCLWSVSHENVPLVDSYSAVPGSGWHIRRILAVQLVKNDRKRTLCPLEYELSSDWSGVRLKIRHDDADRIRILSVLVPVAGGNISIPDQYLTQYSDGIVYAACCRIVRQTGRPWFSPELEQYFNMQYLREVTRAITTAEDQALEWEQSTSDSSVSSVSSVPSDQSVSSPESSSGA